MREIDRMLYKAIDPLFAASELNFIACKHRCCGNKVERGQFGLVKVLFANGEAHYVPTGRGIEISILKYDGQEAGQSAQYTKQISKEVSEIDSLLHNMSIIR